MTGRYSLPGRRQYCCPSDSIWHGFGTAPRVFPRTHAPTISGRSREQSGGECIPEQLTFEVLGHGVILLQLQGRHATGSKRGTTGIFERFLDARDERVSPRHLAASQDKNRNLLRHCNGWGKAPTSTEPGARDEIRSDEGERGFGEDVDSLTSLLQRARSKYCGQTKSYRGIVESNEHHNTPTMSASPLTEGSRARWADPIRRMQVVSNLGG